jgi:hypothetical protein
MMIGSAGAVATARGHGAAVVTPPTLGVGLLEFHQLDRMVLAGRRAARELLEVLARDTEHPGVWPTPGVVAPRQEDAQLVDVRPSVARSP